MPDGGRSPDGIDEQEAKRRKRHKWDPVDDEAKRASGASGEAETPSSSGQDKLAQPDGGAAFDLQHSVAGPTHALQLDIQRPRVYVGNVEHWVTEQEMMQIFSPFGTVTGINMPREGAPPRNKGYCFVEYVSQSSANQAIASLQDFILGGRNIRVCQPTQQRKPPTLSGVLAIPAPAPGPSSGLTKPAVAPTAPVIRSTPLQPGEASGSTAAPSAAAELRRVTVSGIPSNVEVRDIRAILQPYGTIVRCDLLPPSSSTASSRIAGRILAEFASEQSAYGALRSLQGYAMSGSMLHLQLGSPGGTTTELTASPALPPSTGAEAPSSLQDRPAVTTTSRILSIENLVGPGEADEDLADEVREECGNFGKVEKVKVHELGQKKKVRVLVTFKETGHCGKAAAALNGRWFGGRQVQAVPYVEEDNAIL